MKKILIMLLCCLCATSCFALDKPKKGALDNRVLTTDFREGQVYPINAVNGLITTIVFSPKEEVQNWGSGYSSAWWFDSRANLFFLKPMAKEATTNLVVVTDKRTYLFDVNLTESKAAATYRLTFRYPEDEKQAAAERARKTKIESLLNGKAAEPVDSAVQRENNRYYTMNFGAARSSRRIAPIEVFDDGKFTYLKFPDRTDFPAAYRTTDEEETLLNSHLEGGYLVLHGVYEEVRLRAGKGVVGIYNEKFRGSDTAEESGTSVEGLQREIVGEK